VAQGTYAGTFTAFTGFGIEAMDYGSLTVSARLSATMGPRASAGRMRICRTSDTITASRSTATLRRNIARLDGQADACMSIPHSNRKPN
jgi:hypothetical protein